MTVSQIRELMQERVVPESVLPQNIAAVLMDENAVPPELDAFTFLNRLRSLGIGSADFLYLLKGCGAPEEAVEKIEQHPDMNLQTLIVTLDGSGLTPKDYTRMLYTARQLWERTITMRIDQEELQEALSEPKQEEIYTAQQKKPEPEPHEPVNEHTEKAAPRTARQKKKQEPEFREYVGVKPIGRRDKPDDDEETADKAEIRTAVQLKSRQEADLPDDDAEPEEADIPATGGSGSRGSLIAAAVGAVCLCVLNVGIGMFGFTAEVTTGEKLHFAADTGEIFAEIHTAYNAGMLGGADIQALADNSQIFGDRLVQPGEQLGVYSSGSTVWAAEPDIITVYEISDDTALISAEIEPPKGAQFVRMIQTDSGITAIFSGEDSCGAAGISDSGQAWISRQCGQLTDIYCSGDIIRLGSVYTPSFTESFTIADELAYLPWTGISGENTPLLPSEIAVNGSAAGCSYAVNAEYSAVTGEITARTAALGDPLYSGAESFSAAMRQNTGTLLISVGTDGELLTASAPEITACAAGNGLFASAEEAQDGTLTVYIRDGSLQPVSAFTAGDSIALMKIDGGCLFISDGEKITMAADISEPSAPAALKLTAENGMISGEYSLCYGTSPAGITLTLYKQENGKAVQADSFSKTLTAEELKTFSFRGANTMVINGADICGAAYRWFDGVSVVDEFAVMGRSRSVRTLYDDKQGFTAAAVIDGELTLLCGEKIYK